MEKWVTRDLNIKRLETCFMKTYALVRSEELGVRSGRRGAQLKKRPNTPFYSY